MTVKQIFALLMSVLLVVGAGSAVALSAGNAGGQAVDHSTVRLQDDETGNDTTNETGNATVGNETGNATAGNETAGNETGAAGNDTGNVTGAANVTFDDQVAENDTVTVRSVTVPEGGFVTIHTGDLLQGEVVASVIGVSAYLEPGTHENVTVRLYENVSGANFTQSSLNVSEALIAMPHLDTNGNETYDFVASNGTEDGPYVVDGEAVTDQAFVEAEVEMVDGVTNATNETNATLNVTANESTNVSVGNESNDSSVRYAVQGNETNATGNATGDNATGGNATNATGANVTGNATDATMGNVTANASVTIENQTSNGSAVVVQRVMLSDGGFVEITNANGFSIGNSTYLEPGVHTNVTVRLDDPLAGNQSVTAFALRDSNENQQFDGVGVGNETEQPYRLPNGSAVTDEAFVNVTAEIVEEPANVTDNVTADNVTAGNATNATAGNETMGNATMNATDNATGNASIAADLQDNETNATADGETNVTGNESNVTATLDVPSEQSGDGTTLNVTNASANVRYYVEVRWNDTIYNTTTGFEAGEEFSGSLLLEPALVNVTTVEFEVTVVDAGINGSVLARENVTYTLVTANETDNVTNVTADNETNVTADNATNVTVVNATADNETNVTADNVTADDETANATNVTGNATNVTGNATNVTGDATNATAAVTFDSQTANGTVVVVSSVTVPEGGFVTIHNLSLLEGDAVGSVVGTSEYLEPGTHENVTVDLCNDTPAAGNETLIAMPHLDSNGNETYDFVTSNGTVDPPYTVNGSAVIDNATVTFGPTGNATVADGNETTGNATDGNATEGNETDGGGGDDGGY